MINKEIPTLYMTVGLVASGKTTFAYDLANNINADDDSRTTHVFDSDALREEMFGDATHQGDNGKLFTELHRRIKQCLKNGDNAVYCATNIKSKRRMAFLRELTNIPCNKVCYIMATPYDQCLVNNENRERQVPEEVIERMYKSWNTPAKFEGWDDIRIKYWKDSKRSVDAVEYINSLIDFDQDNPHHALTLGHHMIRTYELISGNPNNDMDICYAASLHDIGKAKTKIEKDEEIFVLVNGFEDLYAVSNYGRVKNIKTEKILKGRDNGHGYLSVSLGSGDRKKRVYIHRLVAQHFIDIPECLQKYNRLDVNHIDSNKQNNFYKNLEWCTRSQNQNHAFRTNPDRNVSGFDKWQSKLSIGEVESIKFVKEHTGYTNEKIGQMFDVDAATVSRIMHNKAYVTDNRVFQKKIAPILPVEHCRYYNHENVGAYDVLFFDFCNTQSDELTIDVSVLINLHMRMYAFANSPFPYKLHDKYRKIWGAELYDKLVKLHEADVNAH